MGSAFRNAVEVCSSTAARFHNLQPKSPVAAVLMRGAAMHRALGSWPLTLAVSTKLYSCALAVAPLGVSLNSQFLRLITNGLIARSAALLSMGRNPASV